MLDLPWWNRAIKGLASKRNQFQPTSGRQPVLVTVEVLNTSSGEAVFIPDQVDEALVDNHRVGHAGFPNEQKPLLYPSVTLIFPFLGGYLP